MHPLTVITLSKDNPHELNRTLSSLVRQEPLPPNCIVVDGSNANFASQIRQICRRHRAGYHWSPPTGIYEAMNLGIDVADGPFVMFVNSGDWLASRDTVCAAIDVASNLQDIHWIIGKVALVGRTEVSLHPRPSAMSHLKIRLGLNWFPHPATVYRLESLRRVAGFEPKLTVAADYLLALRMYKMFGLPTIARSLFAVHHLDGLSARRPALGAWQGTVARTKIFGAAQIALELISLPLLFLLRQLRRLAKRLQPESLFGNSPYFANQSHFCHLSTPETQWPTCCRRFLENTQLPPSSDGELPLQVLG